MKRTAAALVLLVLLLTPAAALAGWRRGEVVPESRPLPVPQAAVEALPSPDSGLLRVRVRGEPEVTVPGSEGVGPGASVALGRDGTVAVSWTAGQVCGVGEDGGTALACGTDVRASVWRRGESPPPATVVDDSTISANSPQVAVGDDGTVMVSFQELDAFMADPEVVHVAVGSAGGPFVRTRVSRGVAERLDVMTVRGAPQLAWREPGPRGTTAIRVVSAAGGALERPRLEALLDLDDLRDLILLRSARGDRLLAWSRGDAHRTQSVRVGAPGRPLGRPLPVAADRVLLALGEAGDFAVLGRRADRLVQRLDLLRGRTSTPGLIRDRLTPPLGTNLSRTLPSDSWGRVGIDRWGRTYAVHDTPIGRLRRGRLRLAVVARSATRGRHIGRARVISSLRRRAHCRGAELVVLGPDSALARWRCSIRAGRTADFDEQARFG